MLFWNKFSYSMYYIVNIIYRIVGYHYTQHHVSKVIDVFRKFDVATQVALRAYISRK